ncbi:MAG: VWA domain-containing protein [Nitrospirae bacterium]|nr:VWA domain-containing protein [Nitrospirota bacterium]
MSWRTGLNISLIIRMGIISSLIGLSCMAHCAFADEQGIDVVIVMDSSGSMKKTDPAGLRKPAARLFVSLMNETDRVGIVGFSDSGQNLCEALRADSRENRTKIFRAIESINSRGPYTNIHDGIKKGFEMLSLSDRKEKMIILMSDGKMDLGNREKEDSLISDMRATLLPEISKAGVKIYTIAFTDYSDSALLEEIAQKGGGFFLVAKRDKDLHLNFAALFERIKSPDSLPLQDSGFFVDESVKEMTLLVTKTGSRASVQIVDPTGKLHRAARHCEDIAWFESKVFDMITVKKPAPGRWKMKFSAAAGDKVFIVANLRLISSFSKSFVEEGSPLKIDGWLEKDSDRLKTKEVLSHISITARIKQPDGREETIQLSDDGKNSDAAQGDGIYSCTFTPTGTGQYSVRIVSEAETFKREKEYVFRVTERISLPKGSEQSSAVKVTQKDLHPDDVSWTSVFIRFGVINAVFISLAAGIFFGSKLLKKKGKA